MAMHDSLSDESPSDITGSVTNWLRDLERGCDDAAAALWNRYFASILAIARARLSSADRRVADEEDIAVSVFDILCRGKIEGRFPQLQDRDDLWRLLVVITHQKSIDRHRHATRQKRGGGKPEVSIEAPMVVLAQITSQAPTPDFLLMMEDEYQRLLGLLRNVQLRQIAISKMDGVPNKDIAKAQKVSVRTIERKLRLIQEKWASLLAK
jgi:DNA-directed RNA polymerase specialized sigma24 family protein